MTARSDDGGSAAAVDNEDDKELKMLRRNRTGTPLCSLRRGREAGDFGNWLFFFKLWLREVGLLYLVAPDEVGDEETEECAMRGLGYPG